MLASAWTCRGVDRSLLLPFYSLSLFLSSSSVSLRYTCRKVCRHIVELIYLPRFLTRGNKSLRKSCDTPASRPNDFPFRSPARSFSTGAVETISTCPAARSAHPSQRHIRLRPPPHASAYIYIYLPRAFYFHPVYARFSVLRGSIRVLFHFFFFFFLFSFFSLLPISFILVVKGFLGILSFGKKVSGWRKKGDEDGDGRYRGCMFLINSYECDSFLSLFFFGFFSFWLGFFYVVFF